MLHLRLKVTVEKVVSYWQNWRTCQLLETTRPLEIAEPGNIYQDTIVDILKLWITARLAGTISYQCTFDCDTLYRKEGSLYLAELSRSHRNMLLIWFKEIKPYGLKTWQKDTCGLCGYKRGLCGTCSRTRTEQPRIYIRLLTKRLLPIESSFVTR